MHPLWPAIHAERQALHKDLSGLTEEAWGTPSLCAGFNVREVLAHLTAAASMGPVKWMAGVIRCRFDFDRQVAMRLAEHLGSTPAETLDRFRAVLRSTTTPPLPRIAVLGEAVVHGEDIRRPLGIHRDHPVEVLTKVAEYYASSDMVVVAKSRVAGLRLCATDGPFVAGSGPEVRGRTLSLVMATTGRSMFLDELEGDGVALLRERG